MAWGSLYAQGLTFFDALLEKTWSLDISDDQGPILRFKKIRLDGG